MMRNNNAHVVQLLLARFHLQPGISRCYWTILCVLFCLLTAGLDLATEEHIRDIRRFFEKSLEPAKVKCHEFVQLPHLISGYLGIKRENEDLKRELDVLKLNNLMAKETARELRELRDVMNIKHSSDRFNVVEKVLGFEKSIYSSEIIISKTHGATTEDSVVITLDGLVGIVVATYKHSARVLPVSSAKISIPVKTNSGVHLIIGGTDKNEMVSREIQDDSISKLKIGDVLYTSGEGGFYSKDIPVAKVVAISPKRTEISAVPIVLISNVNYVWMINSNKSIE